ncbi:MAG: right-handed parallel beta-helix repeat-containing protein, partial [Phycisphaerales bacterium]|nr:right-handed parallel beta-helix repeat-containing protein [Phycisphaerales bacterium]
MRTSAIAAWLAGLLLTAVATGQSFQWAEADGGNGHWYEYQGGHFVWNDAQELALAAGGYLATLTTEAENGFARILIEDEPEGAWIGGKEINGNWTWVTGEPWDFASWNCNHCHPSCQPDYAHENCVQTGCSDGTQLRWGNYGDDGQNGTVPGFIIEWSADCNGDGIVDYGQILDGTYTDDDGNGVPDCCDNGEDCDANTSFVVVPDHYATIQGAIDAVDMGGTVFVRSGTYQENLNYSKPLHLLSESGSEGTVLDGGYAGTVIRIVGPNGGDYEVTGFTITGGVGAENTAGGIYLGGGVDLVMDDCVITGNELAAGEYGGGGIKLDVASLVATNCRFSNNKTSWSGGSIYAWNSCCIEITDCVFEDEGASDENTMLDIIHLQNGSTATVVGCMFKNNVFNDSEIVLWDGSSATIRACEFRDATVGPPSQSPAGGSVISGWASAATTEDLFVCGHPEPFITSVTHDDLGGSSMSDQPCNPPLPNHVLELTAWPDAGIVAHHASITPLDAMTVEYWVNSADANGSSDRRTITKRPGNGGCYTLQVTTEDDSCAAGADVFGSCASVGWGAIACGWTHLAIVVDGATGESRSYTNGVLTSINDAGGPCTIGQGGWDLRFGNTNGYSGTQFLGRLDNIRIWNEPLDIDAIRYWMTTDITPDMTAELPTLGGSWSFEDGMADATGVNNGWLDGGAAIVEDNLIFVDCNENGVPD